MLINTPRQLEMACAQWREAAHDLDSPLAFDTEFVSERRYTALLCLVQVYAPAQPCAVEAIIDPLVLDLAPLLELFADESIAKIVHAGQQDLQILWTQFGCKPTNIFDTQIAAAFLGYGHQAGYADLVRRTIDGPRLSKAQQLTDWAARPLSKAQMSYALDDVRYLPAMYDVLRSELSKRSRLSWAQSEFERASRRVTEDTPDDEIYQKLNLSSLSRRQLGTLRELAATREELARNMNKPPSFIAPDLTLIQMAKLPPQNEQQLRSLRGMPNISRQIGEKLLAAVKTAANLKDDQLPEVQRGPRPDSQTEVVSGLLNVVTQLRAEELEISRSYLASRDQLNALSAWWLKADSSEPPKLPLLESWQRELLGEELLDLLNGRLAISLDGTARGRSRDEAQDGTSVIDIVPIKGR